MRSSYDFAGRRSAALAAPPGLAPQASSDRLPNLLVPRPGAVLSLDRKDSPVKIRLLPIAVIVGALLLALVLGDGTVWPPFM